MRTIIGKNPVCEVIKSGKRIEKIYFLKEKQKAILPYELEAILQEKGVNIDYISKKRLDILANEGNHQGVVAVVEDFKYSTLEEVHEKANQQGKAPFIIILDGITDVHNLGAIIRSAECAGVDGILIPERRSAQINETVAKTSAGALEHMSIVRVGNINQSIQELKDLGYWVYGADMSGDAVYYEEQYDTAVAIVIGGEGKGIAKLTRERCDRIVEIPMIGKVNSLNASCAATLLIYEVLRQRNK